MITTFLKSLYCWWQGHQYITTVLWDDQRVPWTYNTCKRCRKKVYLD